MKKMISLVSVAILLIIGMVSIVSAEQTTAVATEDSLDFYQATSSYTAAAGACNYVCTWCTATKYRCNSHASCC